MSADLPEIYLDANASEPLRPEARDAILRAMAAGPGNPSSGHAAGRRGRRILAEAREAVAALVGATPAEVVLTSGATEANALALRGRLAAEGPGGGIALTMAEHPSLVRLAERLASCGTSVRFGTVSAEGRADPESIAASAPQRGVVCLCAAQSVTGAIQDVRGVSARIARAGTADGGTVTLHCDATQVAGRIPVARDALGAATLSLSGHKFGAPAGIGALVIAEGTRWVAPDGAASQELGRRAGTEAVLLAAGLAAAARAAAEDLAARAARDAALHAMLADGVSRLGGTLLSPRDAALPNTVLVAFPGCPGDALLAALDSAGVRVSAGTACTSLARTPPQVLVAGGVAHADAARAIRISCSWATRGGDVESALATLAAVVPRVSRAYADRNSRLDGS